MMSKILVLFILFNTTIALAQQKSPLYIGYEYRTIGPNQDHVFYIEKNQLKNLRLRGSLRKLDEVWNDPTRIFIHSLKGYAVGIDAEYFQEYRNVLFGLSGGTMMYSARSYSNGGDYKWFVSPTSFLSCEFRLNKKMNIGGRGGILWFINSDPYRNYSGIVHEDLGLFIKYRLN